jgi:polyphosphate glucokinase
MSRRDQREFASGPRMRPKELITKLEETVSGWKFDVASIGFPAPVRDGRMLFLGLGTGLGSALVWDKMLMSLELGDLPYHHSHIIETYLGVPGVELLGERKWKREVMYAVVQLKKSFIADYVVLGGGLVHRFGRLPKGIEHGRNENAFLGGVRLWETDLRTRGRKWRIV